VQSFSRRREWQRLGSRETWPSSTSLGGRKRDKARDGAAAAAAAGGGSGG